MGFTLADLELRFFEHSIENYISGLVDLLRSGKKNFLVHNINNDSLGFLKNSERFHAQYNFKIHVHDTEPEKPLPSGVSRNYKVKDMDAIFIFDRCADSLSKALEEYTTLKSCIVCAPITEHYYKNRHTFVIGVPKAGTHMLLRLLQKGFCFKGPSDIDKIMPESFYFLNGLDQHTEISYLSPYHAVPNHVAAFFEQSALFMYRDPRDIAVSLYHWLTKPSKQLLERNNVPALYHSLHPYFASLSSDHERLMKTICGAPLFNSIRDFVMPFADWLKMPNIIPIRFEDLIGPKGGGSLDAQVELIWKLQLKFHIPGRPLSFAENVFDEGCPTFRKGQIGSYKEEFTEEHYKAFQSLPQDFMEMYGYK